MPIPSQDAHWTYAPIAKQSAGWVVSPNLADYAAARAACSWDEVRRRELDGLPGGLGLNIERNRAPRVARPPRSSRVRIAYGAALIATLGGATPQGLAAIGPPQSALPDTTAITPEMVDAGRKIFHGQGSCFACHGPNLEGGPIAPTLKPHAWKDAKGGDLRAIYDVITHGVNGTAMVSHPGGIGDADVARVAVYIWSVGHRGAKP